MNIEKIVENKLKAIEEQARLDVLEGLGQALAELHKTGIDNFAYADIRKKLQVVIIECEKEFEEAK